MSMIGFPLLLIPLAVVNIVVFLMGLRLERLQEPVVTVGLPSLQSWTITFSDVLLAFALFLLLLEVVKSARPGAKYVTDHLLSLVVFAAAAAEFLMLPQFAHSTFFLLTLMALTDVVAGVWIRAVRPKPVVARAAPPPVEPERPVSRPVAGRAGAAACAAHRRSPPRWSSRAWPSPSIAWRESEHRMTERGANERDAGDHRAARRSDRAASGSLAARASAALALVIRAATLFDGCEQATPFELTARIPALRHQRQREPVCRRRQAAARASVRIGRRRILRRRAVQRAGLGKVGRIGNQLNDKSRVGPDRRARFGGRPRSQG